MNLTTPAITAKTTGIQATPRTPKIMKSQIFASFLCILTSLLTSRAKALCSASCNINKRYLSSLAYSIPEMEEANTLFVCFRSRAFFENVCLSSAASANVRAKVEQYSARLLFFNCNARQHPDNQHGYTQHPHPQHAIVSLLPDQTQVFKPQLFSCGGQLLSLSRNI